MKNFLKNLVTYCKLNQKLWNFLNYSWPGNVRELENLIERFYVLNDNGVVSLEDIPERIRFGENSFSREFIPDDFNPFSSAIDFNEVLREYEKN